MKIGGWLAVLLCAACGSNAPTGYGGFVAQGRHLLCQHQVDCGFADGAYESLCEQEFSTTATLDESQINYDSSKAAGCLSAIQAALDCHQNYGLSLTSMMVTDACQGVVTGKSPVGGSCPNAIECVPDAVCHLSFATGAACTSKCWARVDVGADCTMSDCVTTAFCDFTSKKCVARGDTGAACSGSSQCKPGLVCAPGNSNSTCSAPVPAGGACAYPGRSICASGLICDTTQMPPVCAPEKKMGEACKSDDDCAERLLCNGGTCQPPTPKGGMCQSGSTRCLAPYGCVGGVCSAPPMIGDACPDKNCVAGYCNPTSMKCEAFISVGGMCDPSALLSCVGNAQCNGMTMTCQLCQ